MQMIFHSHANFHKKGCALGLILKVRILELGSCLLPLGSILGTRWSAIGQFFPLFLITAPEVFAKVNRAQFFLFVSRVAIAHSPRAHQKIAKL